jgi:hexokinase
METAKSRMQFIKASSPDKKYEVVDLSSDEPQVRHIDLQDDGSLVGEEISNSLRDDIATFAFFHNNHDNSEDFHGSLVEEQSPEWG